MDVVEIEKIAQMAGQQNNCRVYDVYKHRDRLQVFIDRKHQTVSLKDCENVFHSLRFLLRSELPFILDNKRLEVSSPGVERILRKKWHFEECVGKIIKLVTHSPVSVKNKKTGRTFQSQSLTGKLESIQEGCLQLNSSKLECSISFSEVKSAHLIFKVGKAKEYQKAR